MNIDVHRALDNGYALIPVNGKVPYLAGYNNSIGWNSVDVTHEAWDYWEDKVDFSRAGYGLLLGEKSSGVCALDFDTDDQEIIDRVIVFLDMPVVGAKKGSKGFTCFFRLPEGTNPSRLIYQYKRQGSVAVEFFLGNKQTVLPPSTHPSGGNYSWIGESLLNIDPMELPILTIQQIEMVEKVISSASLKEALSELPKQTHKGLGRFSTITSTAGRLVSQYPGDNERIAAILVDMDRRLFPSDQYFLSKEKIGSSYIGNNDSQNAITWVMDFTKNIMKKDQRLISEIGKKVDSVITELTVTDWADPIPFSERELMQYGADFPMEILPDYLQEYFNDYKDRLCMTPDGMVLSFFVALGSLLQGKVSIYPKGFGDDFYVRPNIFGMVVAPSGMKKDSMVGVGLRFFNEIDNTIRNNEDFDAIKIKEERLISLSKRRKKAIEEGDQSQIESITAEIKECQAEMLEKKEQSPVLRFQNGTTEKMYQVCMENQQRGVLFHQSEFVGLMAMMSKKGSESMRPFFLKLANGTDAEGFSHETIGGSKIKIRKLVGSMIAACQNDALNAMLRPVRVGSIENDGFFQRFLYAFPRDLPMRRQKIVKEKPNYDHIQNLFWLAYNSANVDCGMSDDAIDLFIEFEMEMQLQRSKGIDSALQSLQAKYLGTIPKIAYLLQYVHEKKYVKEITREYMEKAIYFMQWQKVCLEVFWKNSDTSLQYNLANAIMAELKLKTISDGDHVDKIKRQIKANVTDITKALQILENKNYVRLIDCGKSYSIMVNPIWLN